LADYLLEQGHSVRAFDLLVSQVHGTNGSRPAYVSSDAEFVRGDIRDPDAVKRAVKDVDMVVHLAAAVGVGQSMYQIHHYSEVNALGTAVLLETLLSNPVERLVVASSMSVYGEGLYTTSKGRIIDNAVRTWSQLQAHQWDLHVAGELLLPVPTPETKMPAVSSVYALSKYYQERLCMSVAAAYGIPCVGLRFFNVFGPRQSLSNPYTGVLAIFAARLLNNQPPIIYEDGQQRRDFVYVRDVVQACELALFVSDAVGKVFNVGSGQSVTIREVAERLAGALDKPNILPQISGRYRIGDIRNCFADISLAQSVIGYKPLHTLEDGLVEFVEWLSTQRASDRGLTAVRELAERGLTG
jgi:dTDP-L-rhamnose 4-epimerase